MSSGPDDQPSSENSIVKITLDEGSFLRRRPEVEHEREVALFDLLEKNHFELVGDDAALAQLEAEHPSGAASLEMHD